MDVKRWIFCCVLLVLGTSLHAASFDCDKASDKIEKIICGSRSLSSLDSALSAIYQKVYAASDSSAKAKLLSNQRAWVHHARYVCGDEECLTIAYEARIDQLTHFPDGNTADVQIENRKKLDFEGLQIGGVLDEKVARKIFDGFGCGGNKQLEKVLAASEHQVVRICSGKAVFEGQEMAALIELHKDRSVVSIMLTYDTPYPDEGVNSLSVGDLENRMIKTYGQPDILRTESPHQLVQFDPADLIEMTSARDQGGDQWLFANDATIVLEPGAGHQKVEQGHIFGSESVWFTSDAQTVGVTLPAHHPIPIVLTKLNGNDALWKSDESLKVLLFTGGERTCTVDRPVPSAAESGRPRYLANMSCSDFVEIGDTADSPLNWTELHIMRGDRELAEGYIPTVKAVSDVGKQ